MTILVERVRLMRVSPLLAFAEVRLPDVNLCDLRVEVDYRNALRLTAPCRTDGHGRSRPAYSLQPGAREDIAHEIARLWNVSGGGR